MDSVNKNNLIIHPTALKKVSSTIHIELILIHASFCLILILFNFQFTGVIKFQSLAADSHSDSHSNSGFAFRRANDGQDNAFHVGDGQEPIVGYASPLDSPTSYRSAYASHGHATVPCPQNVLISCSPRIQTVPCQKPSYGNGYWKKKCLC